MTKDVCSSGNPVRAMDVLAVARTIMSDNRDRDLIEKVALLQGYIELSKAFPERDYRMVIQKAQSELAYVVYGALKRSRHYATDQRLLFTD